MNRGYDAEVRDMNGSNATSMRNKISSFIIYKAQLPISVLLWRLARQSSIVTFQSMQKHKNSGHSECKTKESAVLCDLVKPNNNEASNRQNTI